MSAFEIRHGASRGAMRTGWLDARFSFSFAGRVDAARPRFGPLPALNEDRMQPGELQWMRAGRGIRHRQWKTSVDKVDHHFQIRFEPSSSGLQPDVTRIAFAPPESGAWRTLVSPRRQHGALDIGVDVTLALGRAAPGRPLVLPERSGGLSLHVTDGRVDVRRGSQRLAWLDGGDAVAFFDGVPGLEVHALSPADLLRFDTAAVDRQTGLPASRASTASNSKESVS